MFRSATFKLTMWYLALVMAISLAFSVVLYNVVTNELARGLNVESQRIYTQFPVFNNNPLLRTDRDYNISAHNILLRLVTFNVVVLFGAGLASYWLAKRTLEPIEEAHEQQKRFTADVSHELRTPLTAIKMESEVALMNKSSTVAELRSTLSSVIEETTKLDELINNLLRLTRLEVDELQQNFSNVHTKDIIDRASATIATLAKNRHQKIDYDINDSLVNGDADSLTQLLVILIDNAIKYSPEGSTINITANKRAEYGQITIHDQGIGIDKQALDKVFDRFYRADNSRTKIGAEGSGLGLSIAKMIIDLHRGNITLKSQVGKGTTAIVQIPLAQTKKSISH